MISLSCSHETPACGVRHYRDAGIVLIIIFVLQILLTALSRSMTVLGDTVHLGSDTLVTLGTWGILVLSLRMLIGPETATLFTLGNIVLLIVGGIMIGVQSIDRIFDPVPIDRRYMLIAGSIGFLGNMLALALLQEARHFPTTILKRNHAVNLVHLSSDTWISAIVVLAALGSLPFGFRVDSILGMLVAVYVIKEGLFHGWQLFWGKEGHGHHH